jgi:GAF domain-containing protein
MMLTRRDGTQFPARITGSPILDDKAELIGLIGVLRDDSERHRLEEELLTQEQQAEVVAVLGTRALVNGARDRELILTEAVEACRRALGADLGVLLDVTSAGDDLVVRVTSPMRGEPIRIPGGSRSIAGYTALAGTVVIVEDASRDKRFDRAPAPEWRGPLMSAVAAPIHGPEGVRGVLLAGLTRTRTFGPSAGHFMQSVANVVGMALQL